MVQQFMLHINSEINEDNQKFMEQNQNIMSQISSDRQAEKEDENRKQELLLEV